MSFKRGERTRRSDQDAEQVQGLLDAYDALYGTAFERAEHRSMITAANDAARYVMQAANLGYDAWEVRNMLAAAMGRVLTDLRLDAVNRDKQ